MLRAAGVICGDRGAGPGGAETSVQVAVGLEETSQGSCVGAELGSIRGPWQGH